MNQKVIIGVGIGGYTFDASAKQVTITDITTVTLKQLLLIVNVTRDKTIYNPTVTNKGANLSGSTFTLDYDTTSHADGDELQIHFALDLSTDALPFPVLGSLGRTWVLSSDSDSVSVGNFPLSQNVVVTSSVLPVNAATQNKQDKGNELLGEATETAPVSDTASSGLNGRLQRIAQRLTSLIALIPSGAIESKYGATAAVSTVSTSTSSVSLIAASATRKEVIIENRSSARLWISYVTPAAVGKGFSLAKNEKLVEDTYRGQLFGIWESAAGNDAQVTQVTT